MTSIIIREVEGILDDLKQNREKAKVLLTSI